jgi:uncharacterized protein YcaQ
LRSNTVSLAEARRIALCAQGLTGPRPTGRIDLRHLRQALGCMGVIQIDSVNVLVRSQELPLFARLGPHPRDLVERATARGELFEYWVHEASHVPTEHHPLHRWKMAQPHRWRGVEAVGRRRALVERVYAQVRDGGPVVAGDLAVRTGPKGPWWDWDDTKRALEYLFWCGRVTARRRASDFARVYDLTERVLPPAVLNAPTPPERDARRELLVLAASHLGVATLSDLVDYHRQDTAPCRPLVRELVDEGRLVAVSVEGWREPAYTTASVRVPRSVEVCALLSPFDPVVWNRARTERLFGFRYRIEIYTPAPKRVFGYYVLPILLDDRLVGRLDLKAHRADGTLEVRGAFVEDSHAAPADRRRVASAAGAELVQMAAWLDLERVDVARNGSLADALWRERLDVQG